MEGTRKRERPRKRWREEFEEDLNIMGIRKKQAANGQRQWGMEGDFIVRQSPHRNVVLEEKNNKNKEKNNGSEC